MKVPDGYEPDAVIGPLIDMEAVEKVEAHIADALK
jgi:acyl-CoA reductase-like NAD-dependent aldehyde dehydrogenase